MEKWKSKILLIVWHFLAWGLFLVLLFFLIPGPRHINPIVKIFFPNILYILFYYFNYNFLVPRYFIRRNYFVFTLFVLGGLVLMVLCCSLFQGSEFNPNHFPEKMGVGNHFHRPDDMMFDQFDGQLREDGVFQMWPVFRPDMGYNIMVYSLVFFLSLGLRITQQWQRTEKERVNAELAFLKAQINPHFLFNTLNNIHSMVLKKSENTSEAIEIFADLMRFVIYETKNAYVPLMDKLQYLNNYIALQKMRLSSTVTVDFKVEGNPYPHQIAPMILSPFIENAFKYGVSTEKQSEIIIRIEVRDHELLFSVKNSKFRQSDQLIESSQVGINNTIGRLNLIYPGKHKLNIAETESEYRVSLQIDLK